MTALGNPLYSPRMADPIADPGAKAATLAAALPYFRRYAGATIVVKYGGHAMGDSAVGTMFAEDIVLLKQVGMNPIVVHGGGPQIGQMLERLKIKSDFVDGLRVTDGATVEIVEMVLSGSINKEIVTAINKAGGLRRRALGQGRRISSARKSSSARGAIPTATSRRCSIWASSASRPRSMSRCWSCSATRTSSR